MRHYCSIALGAGIGLTAALLLYAAKTDGMKVITGSKAFTNTASLSPGLARKITPRDLPRPQAPTLLPRLSMFLSAGFGRGGKRPENVVPKAPAGFTVALFVASGLSV